MIWGFRGAILHLNKTIGGFVASVNTERTVSFMRRSSCWPPLFRVHNCLKCIAHARKSSLSTMAMERSSVLYFCAISEAVEPMTQ